jgi:hypothetical protein
MFLSLLSIRLSQLSLPVELQLKLFEYFSLNQIAILNPTYDQLLQFSKKSPPNKRLKKTAILPRNLRFDWESIKCHANAWFACPFVLFTYYFNKLRNELIGTLEYVPIGSEYPLVNMLLSEEYTPHLNLIFEYVTFELITEIIS